MFNKSLEIIGGFLTSTMAAAKNKGCAVIAMKVLGGSHYILPKFGLTPEILIRYAASSDITLPVIGCSSPEEVKSMVAAMEQPAPLDKKEQLAIMAKLQAYATSLAFYKGVLGRGR